MSTVTAWTVLNSSGSDINSGQMLLSQEADKPDTMLLYSSSESPSQRSCVSVQNDVAYIIQENHMPLNRASSFPPPQFSVCFVYTLTELESRLWFWLALNQRSKAIALGTECCWQVHLFGWHDAYKCECECLCSGTCVLSCPTNPTSSCCPSPVQSTHLCSASSPSTYWTLQAHSLDADGWFWWHVGRCSGRGKGPFWDWDGQELVAADANTSQVGFVG